METGDEYRYADIYGLVGRFFGGNILWGVYKLVVAACEIDCSSC